MVQEAITSTNLNLKKIFIMVNLLFGLIITKLKKLSKVKLLKIILKKIKNMYIVKLERPFENLARNFPNVIIKNLTQNKHITKIK